MGSTNGSLSTAISKSTVNSTRTDSINNPMKQILQNQQPTKSNPSAVCFKPPAKSTSNKMSYVYEYC